MGNGYDFLVWEEKPRYPGSEGKRDRALLLGVQSYEMKSLYTTIFAQVPRLARQIILLTRVL